ncbi:hypothetical protein V8G69_07135 [Gaetbulibacter sp. M235]|uniref:hypothetical protein n=1 Tax=Gaetbulibacter sp. M235 TaxID=3126510 RepID=UPI00374F0B58
MKKKRRLKKVSQYKKNQKPKHSVFWKTVIKNSKQTFVFDRALLSDYLEGKGYKKLNNFGEIQVVQLVYNIVYIKAPMDVYNDVLEYIKLQKDNVLRSCFIEQGENLLITRKAILGGLPEIELNKYEDTKSLVKLFYSNKIVAIKADKIKFQSYNKFCNSNDYIFSDRLINRSFLDSDNKQCDFERFLRLSTNGGEHFLAICTALGYLISSCKSPSLTKAVIITDIQSQLKNEAFGRSGKGLIVMALSYIINVVQYNGKVTDLTKDKFVFQNVSISTSLIVLQDVNKSFLFESLFSSLTDVLSIEKKHRDKVTIPYKYSPKIAITTNYTIPQETDSFKDRKYLLTLNNFFSANNKPEQHFDKLLFDWTESEWARFDKFIIKCIQLFLTKGLIQYDSPELKLRKLMNMTSDEFVEIMDAEYNVLNEYWNIKDIAVRFELKSNDKNIKSKIVSEWMEFYALFRGYKINRRKSGGITKICFTS